MKIYQIFLLFGLLLVAQGKPIYILIVSLIFMSQFMGKLMHLLSKNTDFSAFVYFLKSKRVNVNIVYSVPKNSTIFNNFNDFLTFEKVVETLCRFSIDFFVYHCLLSIDFFLPLSKSFEIFEHHQDPSQIPNGTF